MTAAERKTLLGAGAGMTALFGTSIATVLSAAAFLQPRYEVGRRRKWFNRRQSVLPISMMELTKTNRHK